MLPSLELIKRDMRTEFSKQIPAILPIKIIKAIKEIEKKYAKAEIAPATTYIKDLFFTVKEAYTKSNPSVIFSKDVKYLPFILDFKVANEERIIEDRNMTIFILEVISSRYRTNSVLAKLAKRYIILYGSSYQGLEVLRQFILTNLKDTSSKRKSVQKYKENLFLFERDAAMLAVSRAHSVSDVREFLDSIGLSQDLLSSGFVNVFSAAYFKAPAIAMGKKLNNLRPLLETPDGGKNMVLMKGLYASADVLIPFADTADQDVRTEVRQFYLRHLSDPRFPGAIGWAQVSPEASAIFKRWVSKFDLDAFFELIEKSARDDAWAYRKKFWETYLPHISCTWVVLGPDARNCMMHMRNSDRGESERFRSYAELKGASSAQSVFMFEMRGYIFIEWSHSGALRVWKKTNSPIVIGEKLYLAVELRSDCDYEQKHYSSRNYVWQAAVKQWITSHCGIVPNQSFRL